MGLLAEIEILKQQYLNKRNTFALHPDEIKSQTAREFIEKIDVCMARILVEYESEKKKQLEKSKESA